MSKIMSILEKCNLVEKVIKEDENNVNLNEEENTPVGKILTDEESDYKEEIKVIDPIINEKHTRIDMDMEYEKKMIVNDIYSLYDLKNSNINTVFMLQNFINALPQNLPKDVVKQSVINIINASNIDLNELLSDGEQRLEVLAKVMEGYYNQTNKRVAEYKKEIDKLSNLISNCKEEIKIKENMLEEQICLIKYEAEKINSIIDFFPK